MTNAPVQAGDILAGKYRVEKILGAGAMGMVLAATQIALDRRVALKFMTGAGAGDQQQQARFLREALAASKLQSQHAAKVLDMGTLEGGEPYIVMEFLDGKDLAAELTERGPLPVEEAVSHILQACEAVAEAHAAGIIHRDIKPANLFLTKGADRAPCVKLVDFGVAKLEGSSLNLTGTVQVLGSPLYMSPEALTASKDADGRSDIWALGVTLYELLAQITPFHAPTLTALCSRVYMSDPDPIERYRPGLPPGLAAVIAQCFEKDLDRRWPSVAAFASALAPYAPPRLVSYAERVASVQRADVAPSRPTDLLPSEPTPAAVRALSAARAAASPAITGASLGPSAPHRTPRAVAVVGVALALGLSVAAFFGWRARGRAPGDTTIPIVAPTASAPATLLPTPTVPMIPETAVATVAPANPTASIAVPPASTPRTKAMPATRAAAIPRPPEGPWGGGRH